MFTLQLLGGASLDGPDGPVAGRAALRQRVAMLALLAVEHPRPLSRDRLLAYLWPESGNGEARQLLRESLYILRSALGDDSVLSTGDDLRLNPARLISDLWEFDAALARDAPEVAVDLYHGPFLNGFHLSDAEEFERWVEAERSRLARRYGHALEQLASRDGDPVRAAEWWGRLADEDPYNSRIVLGYMQALEAAGDRAGALRHAAAHSELLRAELDAAPEAGVVALAERLRLESRTTADGVPGPTDGPTHPSQRAVAEPSHPKRRGWILPAVAALALVVGLGILGGALSGDRSPALNPRRVAVAVFANHTGRPDLDDLGSMTADWIVRGLMETPLVDVTDLETVYADERDARGLPDQRALARRNGAGLVISGNFYRSGDSVLFQAGVMEVASGRMLRSFAPVGAPVEKAADALEALRDGIAGGLGALLNPANQYFPVDPDLVPPPNYPAYREFIAGLRLGKTDDWEGESQHYRRAAELDSTFLAPLVQLAYRATWLDQCALTDSIGTTLERRRQRLTTWDRFTIDLLVARCRGDMETAVGLLGKRLEAYPRSLVAQRQYAFALQHSNQPRAAREVLSHIVPNLYPEIRYGLGYRAGYWWSMAASHHMLGHYLEEVDITNRWRDSTGWAWRTTRGRALGALGREREALELLQSMTASSIDSAALPGLTMATELAVHGHSRAAMAVAESILVRLELAGLDSSRAGHIALANRLLGRKDQERVALEHVARHDPDTLARLEARGRIAVLLADTAQAERIDSILAEQSNQPLRTPRVRGAQILARAHIAAGLGRREQAVALLRSASARGILDLGPSHAYHQDLLLTPLKGYAPFDALLEPDN
jgi:DNA-binding SARP family transcriptional activator/TolB-like protein